MSSAEKNPAVPAEADAMRIAAAVLGTRIERINRFATGAANWVFEVTTAGGGRAVVRISRCARECAGGIELSTLLRPMGVPLPEIFAHHLPPPGSDEHAWTVTERLPGTDLGNVYASLTLAQKLAILQRLRAAQAIVHRLPRPKTFGFADGLAPPPYETWLDLLIGQLERSRRRIAESRIAETGVVRTDIVERVLERVCAANDFRDVEPVPFLEDTTTRNVIVDVDGLCYGDPLFVVALTRMALLSRDWPTDYADAWFEALRTEYGATNRRLDHYTAIFGVNFLSELGQQFNAHAPPAVDPTEAARLTEIVESLLERPA